jgi:hypothetical protein
LSFSPHGQPCSDSLSTLLLKDTEVFHISHHPIPSYPTQTQSLFDEGGRAKVEIMHDVGEGGWIWKGKIECRMFC